MRRSPLGGVKVTLSSKTRGSCRATGNYHKAERNNTNELTFRGLRRGAINAVSCEIFAWPSAPSPGCGTPWPCSRSLGILRGQRQRAPFVQLYRPVSEKIWLPSPWHTLMPAHRDVLKGDPGTEPEQQHKHGATDERLEAHRCPQALRRAAQKFRPRKRRTGKLRQKVAPDNSSGNSDRAMKSRRRSGARSP
jgi:hypothetical protein